MTRPTIPETYAAKDWPRRVRLAADAIWRVIDALAGRVDQTEAGIVAASGAISALDGRVTALESAGVFTFAPTIEPDDPVAGMTYFDSWAEKLRTLDGTNWQDHW